VSYCYTEATPRIRLHTLKLSIYCIVYGTVNLALIIIIITDAAWLECDTLGGQTFSSPAYVVDVKAAVSRRPMQSLLTGGRVSSA
jgi:hypothetical protein